MSTTTLKEIMARDIETVGPEATLKECAAKMGRRDVGFLPVIEDKSPVGVVTDRDIALRAVAEGFDVSKTKVRGVMTTQPYFAYEDQTINEACHVMETHKVRRLLVLTHDGALAGIVSLNDVTIKAKQSRRSAQALRKIAAAA